MLKACSLECIVEPAELLFSGAMAPLDFKPAASSSPKLDSYDAGKSVLDYAKGLLKEYGINSSAVSPLSSGCKSQVDQGVLDYIKGMSAPSPSFTPKLDEDYTAKRWDNIVDELNLNIPSHPLQPWNKSDFSHDWSSQNNVNGFNNPSSPFNPFETKTNSLEQPEYKMSELPSWGPEIPKFEPSGINLPRSKPTTPNLNLSQFSLPKPDIPQFDHRFKKETFEIPGLPNYKKSLDLIEKESLNIYSFNKEVELHIHHDCSGANLQIFGEKFKKFDSYESAMIDYWAKNLGFNPIIDSCNKLKRNKEYLP